MEGGQAYKIGYVIQARMKSDRLPGKVLMKLPLGGEKTILDWIIDEIVKLEGKIIVATSIDSSNDIIQDFCISKEVECFRGAENDVLSRFIDIQKQYNFEHIVRLTADNPFIESDIVNSTLEYHKEKKLDYTHSSGLPLGMNVEVVKGSSLLKSLNYIKNDREREHVTMVIREHSDFKSEIINFKNDSENLRLTVDTIEDFLLANGIASFSEKQNLIGMELVNKVYDLFPFLFDVNRDVYQKRVFSSIQEELESATSFLRKNDFVNVANVLETKFNR